LTNGKTVIGEMRQPVEGWRYRFWGEEKPQKNRPGETAFEFTHYDIVIDQSVAGVAHYLAEYIKGVGSVKATAICEHFGDDVLAILRATPERVSEVEVINESVAAASRSVTPTAESPSVRVSSAVAPRVVVLTAESLNAAESAASTTIPPAAEPTALSLGVKVSLAVATRSETLTALSLRASVSLAVATRSEVLTAESLGEKVSVAAATRSVALTAESVNVKLSSATAGAGAEITIRKADAGVGLIAVFDGATLLAWLLSSRP
jgi:hypothetical protein